MTIHPTHIELRSKSGTTRIDFRAIARWRRFSSFFRLIAKLGFGVRGRPSVGHREWFHPPGKRSFSFYTNPIITIYLAAEPDETPYDQTLFVRITQIIMFGGFATFDNG